MMDSAYVKSENLDAGAGRAIDPETGLPVYCRQDFDIDDQLECDMIMKGGITSGIVYPYAILEIATKYRFRSLGGTSAGAIAAAFAAAAEYGRLHGRPDSFLVLKRHCDELPGRLLSLFQPSPELLPVVETAKSVVAARSIKPLIVRAFSETIPGALLAATAFAAMSWFVHRDLYAASLAGILGLVLSGIALLYSWSRRKLLRPLTQAWEQLPKNNFGFCTGMKEAGSEDPALTDWIYRALQEIAFGDPDHEAPLTFGDLMGPDKGSPVINLKVVTTNLSMRRPHTLPFLGMSAGFVKADWQRLFPERVMAHLTGEGAKRWDRDGDAWAFPDVDRLPVIVAVRMSLSFPLLFTTVPLRVNDTETLAIVGHLVGTESEENFVRTAHFSDGGISSNFPVHMFDAPLPTRPTFAIGLDDLPGSLDPTCRERVMLPANASEGIGVPVRELASMVDFGWQVLNSAKDWQDQLLSEITGQRERIAKVFLSNSEGGLNLDMSTAVSRQLMKWGHAAGQKFAGGAFDFDEHRWRRTIALYHNLEQYLQTLERGWIGAGRPWYNNYSLKATSYKKLTSSDRGLIRIELDAVTAGASRRSNAIRKPENKFPRRIGQLRIGPRF
jgi:predicted acylesterase/phospholipase RssA